jgi:hypothetical protein
MRMVADAGGSVSQGNPDTFASGWNVASEARKCGIKATACLIRRL